VWEDWLPDGAMLDYLQYVVVEVVAPRTTVGLMQWVDEVVSGIIAARLHTTKRPGNGKSGSRPV
jgi:hypothetical protein